MSLNYKDGADVTQEITALKFMDDDGVDHTITALRRGARIIYPTAPPGPLLVTISPDDVTAIANSFGYAFAGPLTATPSGGSGTYVSYLWAITSQSSGAPITVSTPANASTTLTEYPVHHFDEITATGTCTVTDSLGATGVGNFTIAFNGDSV